MSIEGLAPYSPTTIYGQLTSPFTPNIHHMIKLMRNKRTHQRYLAADILKANRRQEVFMEKFQRKVLMKMI